MKGSTEGAEAREPDIEADVGHASIGFAQQEHGALDTPALKVSMRSLVKRRAERPDEVRFRYGGEAREGWNVERLGVGAVHSVAGAQHPAVDLFEGSTHR
jgi:hypothetical protein